MIRISGVPEGIRLSILKVRLDRGRIVIIIIMVVKWQCRSSAVWA